MIPRAVLQPVRIAGRRALQPVRNPFQALVAGPQLLHPVQSASFLTYPFRSAESPSPKEAQQSPPDASTSSAASSSPSGNDQPASSPTSGNGSSTQEAELAAQKQEIIDLKDRYLRSRADFINLQERTKRDVASARSFAISNFAKDLIESVDNFERALDTVSAETLSASSSSSASQAAPEGGTSSGQSADALTAARKETTNLYNGLRMTEGILMQTLKKHGLERIDPAESGEKFDPIKHEALFQQPVEGKEDGTVFHTQQKGFLLNGRTLRAAKVGIVRNA